VRLRPAKVSARITRLARWLTPRRIRTHAILLAVCLWGVCAVDFATLGLYDRAGNIKFQDFLPLYTSASLISQGRASHLYDQQEFAAEIQATIHTLDASRPSNVVLPNLYGPQVAFLFLLVSHLPFLTAAWLWTTFSLLTSCICIGLVWRSCAGMVAISAAAFPPLFHSFVRGQLSALVLVCFTAALLAFRADRNWLAGVALGLLVFKPQFLVAIPLILLLAGAWKVLAGVLLSSIAQLALTWCYFGTAVMRAYFTTLWHASQWIRLLELNLAPIQMHSLRSFWSLLVSWPTVALAFYVVSSIAVIAIAAAIWRSSSPLARRFSALTLAAVLVNPHLFVYDLLALAPVFLILVDWILSHTQPGSCPALRVMLYLAFILPLFGPLSRWTHLQLSVLVFLALLYILRMHSATPSTKGHKLAPGESSVV
jgi:hypothetical protein